MRGHFISVKLTPAIGFTKMRPLFKSNLLEFFYVRIRTTFIGV